jgi:hypothetical protein
MHAIDRRHANNSNDASNSNNSSNTVLPTSAEMPETVLTNTLCAKFAKLVRTAKIREKIQKNTSKQGGKNYT